MKTHNFKKALTSLNKTSLDEETKEAITIALHIADKMQSGDVSQGMIKAINHEQSSEDAELALTWLAWLPWASKDPKVIFREMAKEMIKETTNEQA